MMHNEQIKQHMDDIITFMSKNKDKYVKNPDKDFTRERKLPFEKVIKLILSMKGGSLNKEIYEYFDRDVDNIVTSSAFIQQRDKLTEDVFVDLFHMFNNKIEDLEFLQTYKGYRLFAVDGSDINVAYNENADTFVKPLKTKKDGEPSKGYNQYHLNAVYDLLNKTYTDVSLQPRPQLDERKAFIDMLVDMELNQKSLFIMDRGYPSWNLMLHFKYKKNADFLIRTKNSGTNLVKDLPMMELDIVKTMKISTLHRHKNNPNYHFLQVKKNKMTNREYSQNDRHYVDWDFGDYEELTIRIVRFKITDDTYETVFTSLSKELFSLEEIKKLYGMRWGIETSFRELKYIIGLTNMHSKKNEFIIQEIYAKLTAYNFCEAIISSVVVEQDENRKHNYQVNYTMAMRICLDFYRCLVECDSMYQLILKYIEPIRPGRQDKRKKIRPKSFICFTYRVAA